MHILYIYIYKYIHILYKVISWIQYPILLQIKYPDMTFR